MSNWPNGNFLYPYARALMLGARQSGAAAGGMLKPATSTITSGIGWEETSTVTGNQSPFRVMFLNAGVGTQYAVAPYCRRGYTMAGHGVSGYAYNPVTRDSNSVLRPFDSTGFTDTPVNLNPNILNFGGAGITVIYDIPPGHRTYSHVTPWLNNLNPLTSELYFGGTANSAIVSGCAITYNGVADANDVVHYAVPSGAMVSAFVLYKLPNNAVPYTQSSAWASTSEIEQNSILVAYFDSATGLPVQGNGGDITVVWDNGLNRIFRI